MSTNESIINAYLVKLFINHTLLAYDSQVCPSDDRDLFTIPPPDILIVRFRIFSNFEINFISQFALSSNNFDRKELEFFLSTCQYCPGNIKALEIFSKEWGEVAEVTGLFTSDPSMTLSMV